MVFPFDDCSEGCKLYGEVIFVGIVLVTSKRPGPWMASRSVLYTIFAYEAGIHTIMIGL